MCSRIKIRKGIRKQGVRTVEDRNFMVLGTECIFPENCTFAFLGVHLHRYNVYYTYSHIILFQYKAI